jgi:hypothetical protein
MERQVPMVADVPAPRAREADGHLSTPAGDRREDTRRYGGPKHRRAAPLGQSLPVVRPVSTARIGHLGRSQRETRLFLVRVEGTIHAPLRPHHRSHRGRNSTADNLTMKIESNVAAALGGIALITALPAAAQSDEWKFSVMPYLWLPSVDGKLRYGPPQVNGGTVLYYSHSGDKLIDNLSFGGVSLGANFRV